MKKFLLAVGLLLFCYTPAHAGVPCSVPFNLTNGTVADATQVMANYNAILSCLSTSAAAAGSNNDITALNAVSPPLAPAQGGTGNASAGTTGQCLVSTGTSYAPTSGCMVLLVTLTASNSPTLSDTTHITSAYNEYVFVMENVIAVNNSTTLVMNYHTGGSFPTSNYTATATCASDTTTNLNNASGGIEVSLEAEVPNYDPGVTGRITLYNPSSSTNHKMINGISSHVLGDSNVVAIVCTFTGWYNATTAVVDGVQFRMVSGNIASGVIKIYGVL